MVCEKNCEFLDLFGTCGDPGTKEKNYNGIHEYKRKMGGTYTEFVGEYDIVNKPFINKMLPIKKTGKILYGPFFSYTEIAYPDWVWGTFFMFDKKLLDIFPNKLLPETFWMYIEDMQWCWLASQKGYEIVFVPEARVLHLGGKNHSERARAMMDKNLSQFLYLYYNKIHAKLIIYLSKLLELSQWRN